MIIVKNVKPAVKIFKLIFINKGLKMYEIDEENKTITVYYNSKKTNLETIRKTIFDLGFDADDIKANPLAYEKLDDCCKKV